MEEALGPDSEPDEHWTATAREWLQWFGLTRVATAIAAIVVIGIGAVWLLRAPPPDVASGLPAATTSTPSTSPPSAASTLPATSLPTSVVVHVTGAVRRPGVYALDPGSRVSDAIDVAGGAGSRADESQLNLAALAIDGSRIEVPRVGEVAVPVAIPSNGAAATSAAAGPVDVNRAAETELETLPGVGPATAAAIVTERETNGPFVSVDDIDRVPGIGPARLAALRDLIVT